MLMQQEMSDRQLRYFGASLVAMLLIFAALFHWRWQIDAIAWLLVVAGGLIGIAYYAVPSTQRAIYRGFRVVTYPIQLVASAIILAVVYYVVLAPIGMLLRLKGVNLRQSDPDARSHWSERKPTGDATKYFDTY